MADLNKLSKSYAFVCTPSDANDLVSDGANAKGYQRSTAVWVGGAGALSVIMADGNAGTPETVLFSGIPAGTLLPISVRRIRATGTTATLIVPLFSE